MLARIAPDGAKKRTGLYSEYDLALGLSVLREHEFTRSSRARHGGPQGTPLPNLTT